MSDLECPAPGSFSEERVDRVLTQYRESPKLLGLIRSYLELASEIHLQVCDLPNKFDLTNAVGHQLTVLGKRMGFPRNHRVCSTPRVVGFDCPEYSGVYELTGFCDENSTWLSCEQNQTSEIIVNDDDIYRRLLLVRRFQIQKMYDIDTLNEACDILFGDQSFAITHSKENTRSVVIVIGRELTNFELELLQVYPRVLPIFIGTKTYFHFNAVPIAGFGYGWGGFCENAQWLCPIEVNAYECE